MRPLPCPARPSRHRTSSCQRWVRFTRPYQAQPVADW